MERKRNIKERKGTIAPKNECVWVRGHMLYFMSVVVLAHMCLLVSIY